MLNLKDNPGSKIYKIGHVPEKDWKAVLRFGENTYYKTLGRTSDLVGS
jgi:hypothetical protein